MAASKKMARSWLKLSSVIFIQEQQIKLHINVHIKTSLYIEYAGM